MMDDPCDDVKAYADYIKWTRLKMGGEISRYSWLWIGVIPPMIAAAKSAS